MKNTFQGSFFLIVFTAIFITQSLPAQTRTYHKLNKLKETVEGEKLYSQGKYDDAIDMFKDALKKGETRGEPHYYLGSIHESRHQYEESIPYFQEAVRRELPPEFREATLWKLIILLQKQESYAEMLTYIDQLEDLGIKHENLNKFREEAEINLSPEKIQARLIIKDAKKIATDWESEHPGKEFWSADGIDDLRNSVLEKYIEAVSLDDSLFSLYWEVAGYYEKMANYRKATEVYEKITSRNQDPQAYYKIGVIARKNGDFVNARESFMAAIKNLDENSSIKYYLLVNLSQVLYALGDFENGIRFAKEAKETKANNDSLYDTLIYCLHMSGSNSQTEELKHTCLSFIKKDDLLKKDIRFISLYYYMLAEVNVRLLKNSVSDREKRIRNIIEDYTRSFIPPEIRSAPLKGLKVKDSPESYEDNKWIAIPLWCLTRVDHVLTNLNLINAYREQYIILRLYKKYLNEKTSDDYHESLAVVSFNLGLYDESLSAYNLLKDRNFDQEKGLLKVYLRTQALENFQNEISEYLRLHSDAQTQMVDFLNTDPEVQKIPDEKLKPEIKTLMGIEDQSPVQPQGSEDEKPEKDGSSD